MAEERGAAKKRVAVTIAIMCNVAVFQSSLPQLIVSQSARPVSAVKTVVIRPAIRASHQPCGADVVRDPDDVAERREHRERVDADRRVGKRRMQRVARQPSNEIAELHAGVVTAPSTGKTWLAFRRLEKTEEGRVLAEELLDLRNAGTRPVLDPRVRKVVLDVMKAPIAHTVMIDHETLGSMGRTAHLQRPHGLLLINPRSGSSRPDADELAREAEARGVEAHILRQGEDAGELARAAEAVALGMAGGDGSLGLVARVALERDLGFVCVPFGTRNHFARDLGLDRNDPLAALAAFDSGRERRIDVGRVDERVFLNNVSFGIYARLVRRREAHRRRRDAFARLRALWLTAQHRHPEPLTLNGERLDARIVLIANNSYELDVFELGARDQLDAGALHAYIAEGWLPRAWDDRRGETFTVEGVGNLRAAVDGEPVELGRRSELRIEPRALRILVP